MIIIFKYEWRQFIRNRVAVIAWLFMFGIGLYAVYYGHSFQRRQLNTIYQIDTAYQAAVSGHVKKFDITDTSTKEAKADYRNARDAYMGEYYSRPVIWKQPDPLQAFTIGQSDNQPFFYNMWVSAKVYHTKLYELRNPAKLKAGNFDLAFVIIYLLPLLLIAYCYNILAADKEHGITRLLSAQGVSLRKILFSRLLFRGLLVLGLAVLVSVTGFIVNGVSNAGSITGWLATTACYLFFWAGIVCMVVALQRNGAITALLLVCSWVLFLLLLPAAVQKLQQRSDTAGVELADADRDYGALVWKTPRAILLDSLHLLYPEWRQYPVKDSNLIRGMAYYILTSANMTRLGQERDKAILDNQRLLERFDIVNPAFTAQRAFNKLAQTEVSDFITFKEAAASYQLQRMDYVNAFRIADKEIDKAGFLAKPVFQQPSLQVTPLAWLADILPLIIITICSFLCAYLFTKKPNY